MDILLALSKTEDDLRVTIHNGMPEHVMSSISTLGSEQSVSNALKYLQDVAAVSEAERSALSNSGIETLVASDLVWGKWERPLVREAASELLETVSGAPVTETSSEAFEAVQVMTPVELIDVIEKCTHDGGDTVLGNIAAQLLAENVESVDDMLQALEEQGCAKPEGLSGAGLKVLRFMASNDRAGTVANRILELKLRVNNCKYSGP